MTVLGLLPPLDTGAAEPRCQPGAAVPFVVVEQRLYRYESLLVDDVLVANTSHVAVDGIHVSVEFYNFFDELLRAERTILTPPILPAGGRASFRVATPFTQDVRKVAYRFTGRRGFDGGYPETFQAVVVCDART